MAMLPRVLITGVSGVVGRAVASRLVRNGVRVVGLARGYTYDRLLREGLDGITVIPLDEHKPREKHLELVQGDICETRLALDSGIDARLRSSIRGLVHCAAMVRFGFPDRVYLRTNLQGTKNVVRFAEACDPGVFQGLVYLSTLFVAGRSASRFREGDLDVGQEFANAYERSKFLAEVEVRSAFAQGLPGTIVRLGAVAGEHATGSISEFGTLYPILRVGAKGLMRFIPGRPEATFSIVPVDYVAAALELLAGASGSGQTLHLMAAPSVALADLLDILAEYPALYVPQMVEPGSFDPKALVTVEQRVYWRLVRHYEPYLQDVHDFDDTASRVTVAGLGLHPPPADPAYLRRMVDYCVKTGYF